MITIVKNNKTCKNFFITKSEGVKELAEYPLEDIFAVSLTREELWYVRDYWHNVPISNNTECCWLGDMANFIAYNLVQTAIELGDKDMTLPKV